MSASQPPDDVVLTIPDSYRDLLAFVREPANGFLSMTVPFPEGFEIMIYKPSHVRENGSRPKSCLCK
jgi:hypothetical protein